MEILGIHICQDELCAMAGALPFVSLAWYRLKARFSKRHANCNHAEVRKTEPGLSHHEENHGALEKSE